MDERRQEELRQLLAVIGESIQAVTKKADEAMCTFPVEIKRDIKHEKKPMRLQQLNKELNESYKAYRQF